MNEKYLDFLENQEDLTGLEIRVLIKLRNKAYCQSTIARLFSKEKSHINKSFKKLKHKGLIEEACQEGNLIFYKTITDVKRLKANIPGQINLLQKGEI